MERAFAAQDLLDSFLRAHDLAAQRSGDWILTQTATGTPGPPIRARVVKERQVEGRTLLQVDIDVAVGPDTLLTESFAGAGPSPDEALKDAFRTFAAGTLHVLLVALWDREDHCHVAVEEWGIGGETWRAVIGPLCTRSASQHQPDVPEGFEPTIEAAIRAARLPGDLCWVRAYVGQTGRDHQPVCEVLLNNEPWSNAESAVRGLPWPQTDDFQSSRIFLVLRRLTAPRH